jgi:hypothetical protein
LLNISTQGEEPPEKIKIKKYAHFFTIASICWLIFSSIAFIDLKFSGYANRRIEDLIPTFFIIIIQLILIFITIFLWVKEKQQWVKNYPIELDAD